MLFAQNCRTFILFPIRIGEVITTLVMTNPWSEGENYPSPINIVMPALPASLHSHLLDLRCYCFSKKKEDINSPIAWSRFVWKVQKYFANLEKMEDKDCSEWSVELSKKKKCVRKVKIKRVRFQYILLECHYNNISKKIYKYVIKIIDTWITY